MATFYGGRDPSSFTGSNYRIFDPRQGGTGMVRGFFNNVPQKKRNFSALNLSNAQKQKIRNDSYLRNNLIPPNWIASNRQPEIGIANQRTSGFTPKKPETSTPNLSNNLLNFAVSPEGRALQRGLLEAGQYSPVPQTFAGALSKSLGYLDEYEDKEATRKIEAEKFDFQKSQATIQNLFTQQGLDLELQKLLKPELSSFAKDLMAVGIDPDSPEGRDLLLKKITSATTHINMGEGKKAEMRFGAALDELKEEKKVYRASTDLDGRLQMMESLLKNPDFETGFFKKYTLPIGKAMAALGMLEDEELEQIQNMEFFDAASSYMIPRMRPVGSGATSNFEVEMFRTAAPNIGNTVEGNKFVIAGMRAVNKYNKKKFREMQNWFDENDSLKGFEKHWEEKFGDQIFLQAATDEEYDQMVKDGKLKEGDLFFDSAENTFTVLDKEHLLIDGKQY